MYRHHFARTTRPRQSATGRRRGFTLVELLVVITIIAMLVGLLIPAIQAARSTARKTQCMNNQRNLGTAILSYATTKEKFPPLFSLQLGTAGLATPLAVGWVPPILPNIEQNELYRAFQNNALGTLPRAEVDLLACPSRNPSGSPAPLSYVVNGGAPDQATFAAHPMEYQENGVFFDEFTPKYATGVKPKPTPASDLSYLSSHDGTKNTIMLSENLDALDWAKVGTPSSTAPLQPGLSSQSRCYWNAIVWEQPTTAMPPNWGTDIDPTATRLNKPATGNKDYELGRPSSNHSGGFMVTFCDGHTQFVSDEIQYRVYCLLMSPDSNGAKYTSNTQANLNGTAVAFPNQWKSATGQVRPVSDSEVF